MSVRNARSSRCRHREQEFSPGLIGYSFSISEKKPPKMWGEGREEEKEWE